MNIFIKTFKLCIIIAIFALIISIIILHNHNILGQLDFEILILLLKNKINIFHLHYNCHEFCEGYISPADFELLILELKGELN
jgi:excinuclease UvrABC helicase subunit UvrB